MLSRPKIEKSAVLSKVQTFADFNGGNEPYKEHGFGAFEMKNRRFFWKIDYYDRNMEGGSKDPRPIEDHPRPHHHAGRGIRSPTLERGFFYDITPSFC
jgi:hypothetical protein